MANEEHLRIRKRGVQVWNRWREENPDIRPDLSGADLNGVYLLRADLSGAKLIRADLSGAKLIRADLSGAHLSGADLSGAYLREASLFDADLNGADLRGADLFQADLSGADLSGADLGGADLGGADLSECRVGYTVFADVDLSVSKGLDTVIHRFPSTIGIDTLFKSGGNIPDVFLRGCGVPDSFIEYARSLVGQAIQYYSCFISHSHSDRRFCERLHNDLQAKGVRVWYFPEDATWGKTVWGEIDRSIKIYDKLVVVCSQRSLRSGPVIREIERALQREDREAKNVLFPIRLDDHIFEVWKHPRKADVVAKVVGDFSGWDTDAAKYETSFQKLLQGLQGD